MEIPEIREKKLDMEKAIGDLLYEFEETTGCAVSGIDLLRRAQYSEGGNEIAHVYIVESEVKI